MPRIHVRKSNVIDSGFGTESNFSTVDIKKYDDPSKLHPNPPTGYKKILLPTLRDRNRQLLSEKISIQNEHVNKSFRRYVN